jgi:hypothetical protein
MAYPWVDKPGPARNLEFSLWRNSTYGPGQGLTLCWLAVNQDEAPSNHGWSQGVGKPRVS